MSVPLICDSGTGYLKVGWANKSFPDYSFPAIIGRPLLRYEEKIDDIEIKVLKNLIINKFNHIFRV